MGDRTVSRAHTKSTVVPVQRQGVKERQTIMLREVKKLHRAVLRAADGELGSVDEILFDDHSWTVRYMVVNTGST